MDVCFLKKKIKFSHTIVSSLTRNEMFYIAFVKDMWGAGAGGGRAAPHLLYKVISFLAPIIVCTYAE